jgi:hypothetical protein
MCYELSVKVVLQNESALMRGQFGPPRLPEPYRFRGQYPDFRVDDGHCACDLVSKGSIKLIPRAAEQLLGQDNVKRVEILWRWIADPPNECDIERISIEEFLRRNNSGQLFAGHRYRINDPRRWERR